MPITHCYNSISTLFRIYFKKHFNHYTDCKTFTTKIFRTRPNRVIWDVPSYADNELGRFQHKSKHRQQAAKGEEKRGRERGEGKRGQHHQRLTVARQSRWRPTVAHQRRWRPTVAHQSRWRPTTRRASRLHILR